MSTTELCGFKVNDKIKSPEPFKGEATIVGFRYYTSRNTGITCMVADYITDDGKRSFSSLDKLVKERAAQAAANLPAVPNIKFSHGNPPDAAFTPTVSRELYDLLRWVTRCATWQGPLGMPARLIAPEVMERATQLVKELEAQ